MELLVNYEWPYNYTQFKRILSELTASYHHALYSGKHGGPCPGAGTHLRCPSASFRYSEPVQSFNLNRTLDEINQDIIHAVLEETGGNQSAAAKRLGISRTTLWRLLKS